MTSLRVLAIAASVALVTPAARADDVLDDSVAGKDLPVLPAHAIKAPAAPSDFLVETRGFLRVVYHPSTFEAVRRITGEADAARASLASTLGQSVLDTVEVRIARTPEELAMLSPPDAPPAPSANAVAYPSVSLIVVSVRSADGSPSALDDLFQHELAHVALFDAAAGRPLPRWLQEGFAVYATGESTVARANILWTAHVRRNLLPFAQLETFPNDVRNARIAWAQSADFVRFLARDRNGTRFAAAIARARSGDALDGALGDAYGADLRSLEQSWRDDVAARCVTIPLATAAVAGWGVAIGIAIARRRRRRRKADEAAEAAVPTIVEPKVATSEPRLLVCDRGLGHVVYITESRPVPKVEHDGKRHTLH